MKSEIQQLAEQKTFFVVFWPDPNNDFDQRSARALLDAYPFFDKKETEEGKITEIRIRLFERMFESKMPH